MAVQNVDVQILHQASNGEGSADGVGRGRRKQRKAAVDAGAFRRVVDGAGQERLITRRIDARPQVVDDSRHSPANVSGHEMKDTDGGAQRISRGEGAIASGRVRIGASLACNAAMRYAFRAAVRISIGSVATIQKIAMPS